jgi:hypothetical protein
MRKFLSSAAAACVAVLLLASTAANAEAAARFKIDRNTSAFYLYDGSVSGTGPQLDAVTVYAQLRDCPAGNYYLQMSLVQDGVSYPVASTALGVGEFSCTATERAPRLRMSFYGNGLYPGPAQVIASVYVQADGMPVLVQSTRTVRIPAGPNQS